MCCAARSLEKCTDIDPQLLDADESDEECTDEKCTEEHDHKHGHEHGHEHGHSHADSGAAAAAAPKKRTKKVHDLSQVSSVGFKFPGYFDVPKFNMFMSTLLQVREDRRWGW